MTFRLLALALVFSVACSAPQAPHTAPPRPSPPPPPPPSTLPEATPPPSATAEAASPPAPPEPPFPPAAGTPPFERTAQPGDGAWAAMAYGEGALVRTTIHPNAIKPFVYVAVVAIDRHRTELFLAAGTDEPPSKDYPADKRTGVVPPSEQGRLIAAFNGGFQARHGGYGMKLDGVTFLPPRADACTFGLTTDGAARIATYSALAPDEAKLSWYRQTPPCLVEAGELNPDLDDAQKAKRWAGAVGGAKDIRRSAIGVDSTGRTLFYGSGEWVTAKDLAVGMKAIGAVAAAELDINYSYTKMLFYGPAADGGLVVTDTLVPKTKHVSRAYVGTAAERDFFYLLKKKP